MSRKIILRHHNTPCGELIIASFNEKLCLCDWLKNPHRNHNDKRLLNTLESVYSEGESVVITKTIKQLNEYFIGQRREFNLPLLLIGTNFQKRVWQALTQVPYGKTISYSCIATKTGNTQATRAVANAIGANSLSIIIPCHRIIGANGSLTGYAGGLSAKQYLLSLEHNQYIQ